MLNKLNAFIRDNALLSPGEQVVCAVSGGADSMALLYGMYLLHEKLGVSLAAAHFNHHLRGEESDADEKFVRDFCAGFNIPLYVGGEIVTAGKKGLEAAARDARYAFFCTLPGKIATAHTADDNAETVLMHLIRGTGLKGLGGIAPRNGNVIRPMLEITRSDVLSFLEENGVSHREDSSNAGDLFLRNRIRHRIMPLLRKENPEFSRRVSQMARQLQQEEELLSGLVPSSLPTVRELRLMPPALRRRCLSRFLHESGIREPERSHISAAEELVFSEKPSARIAFPGGVCITRNYERLEVMAVSTAPEGCVISANGTSVLPQWGICVRTSPEDNGGFHIMPSGRIVVRSRLQGDSLRLPGGTKTLKKWMIDRKIPAAERMRIPVLADDAGIIAVPGAGFNLSRAIFTGGGIYIRVETLKEKQEGDTPC